MQDNMFSDIPGLSDENGFNQFMENQSASQQQSDGGIPPLTQPVQPTGTDQGSTDQPDTQPQDNTTQEPTYTAAQVQQIIASLQAQQVQQRAQPVRQPQVQPQIQPRSSAYSQQEINAINGMLARGYSLEQVLQAVQNNRARQGAPTRDPAILDKINQIERYLANQQYQTEQNAFVSKMNDFGSKFGLSEQDLVTFGNAAMAQGINLINVPDVEIVFKALYPEQYAVRMQRMSNTPTSQIYGGQSVAEAPRAQVSKAEDAYVENFLKRSMPNQYGMQRK